MQIALRHVDHVAQLLAIDQRLRSGNHRQDAVELDVDHCFLMRRECRHDGAAPDQSDDDIQGVGRRDMT
ncbi:hypothetical protein GUG62_06225 [Xanthomonas citri pv. citri]|nr:hypothetical protein [Xanthomonas citri pv. citri]